MTEHNNQGWANPTPAGLIAIATVMFLFYAVLGGHVKSTAVPLLGIWLLGGFVVQVIVGIIDLKSGQITGGNVMLFFGAFLMMVSGLEYILKYFAVVNQWPLDATIDGYGWLCLAIALIVWTPAFLKTTPMEMSLVIMGLDVGILAVALMDLKVLPHTFAEPVSYLCMVVGIIAIYLGGAIVVNTAFGRSVYKIHGPIIK